MGRRPRLTLKMVAQRLGVSTATVSNAFHRPDQRAALPPLLTTVYHDSRTGGVAAARMVSGRDVPGEIERPAWCIHGGSCAIAI